MKKNSAFSYVEIIFAMVVIMSLMVVTLPLLSHKQTNTNSNTGEYRCWCIPKNDNTQNCRWFQQSRYNSEKELSEPTEVDQCSFEKPTGVTTPYTITLIGGGSSSSQNQINMPAGNDRYTVLYEECGDAQTLNASNPSVYNTCETGATIPFSDLNLTVKDVDVGGGTTEKQIFYDNGFKVKSIKLFNGSDAIKIKRPQGGNPGQLIKLSIPAANMPFSKINNVDQIRIVQNGYYSHWTSGDLAIGIPSRPEYYYIDGYYSCIRPINYNKISLPGNYCNVYGMCCAKGGNKPTPALKTDFELIKLTTGKFTSILKGNNGNFNSSYGTVGGVGGSSNDCAGKTDNDGVLKYGDYACLQGKNTVEYGAGASAGAIYIRSKLINSNNYIFRKYIKYELYDDNNHLVTKGYLKQNGNDNIPLNDSPFEYSGYTAIGGNHSDYFRIGNGGFSGGGAVYIEW